MTRVDMLKGYVLHHRPLSDSRKILDIVTAQFGRISGVVRTSKKSPPLTLFQPFLFSWQGKQEFKTFTAFETEQLAFALKAQRLYCGLYLNELLQRLLPPQEEATTVFQAYENTLRVLENHPAIEPHLRHFELTLLRHLGYEYSFTAEAYSQIPLRENSHYLFNPHQGFVPLSSTTLPATNTPLGQIFSGADIIAYERGESSDAVLQLLKRICRQALAVRLGKTPLKSRELFRSE